jgi:hypothetical protein
MLVKSPPKKSSLHRQHIVVLQAGSITVCPSQRTTLSSITLFARASTQASGPFLHPRRHSDTTGAGAATKAADRCRRCSRPHGSRHKQAQGNGQPLTNLLIACIACRRCSSLFCLQQASSLQIFMRLRSTCCCSSDALIYSMVCQAQSCTSGTRLVPDKLGKMFSSVMLVLCDYTWYSCTQFNSIMLYCYSSLPGSWTGPMGSNQQPSRSSGHFLFVRSVQQTTGSRQPRRQRCHRPDVQRDRQRGRDYIRCSGDEP